MIKWKVLKKDILWEIFGIKGLKEEEYNPEKFVDLYMDVIKAFDFKDRKNWLKQLEKDDQVEKIY